MPCGDCVPDGTANGPSLPHVVPFAYYGLDSRSGSTHCGNYTSVPCGSANSNTGQEWYSLVGNGLDLTISTTPSRNLGIMDAELSECYDSGGEISEFRTTKDHNYLVVVSGGESSYDISINLGEPLSCSDGARNGRELGLNCGGFCEDCSNNARECPDSVTSDFTLTFPATTMVEFEVTVTSAVSFIIGFSTQEDPSTLHTDCRVDYAENTITFGDTSETPPTAPWRISLRADNNYDCFLDVKGSNGTDLHYESTFSNNWRSFGGRSENWVACVEPRRLRGEACRIPHVIAPTASGTVNVPYMTNDMYPGHVADYCSVATSLSDQLTYWVEFTGTGRQINISTCPFGGIADTVLAVVEGPCESLSALSCLHFNDDSCGGRSFITMPSVLSKKYYAMVMAYTGVGGSSMLRFSFGEAPAPVVTLISPSDGPKAGGSTITIEGANFGFFPSAELSMKIGPAWCASVIKVSTNRLVCASTPSGGVGFANVEVISSEGGSSGISGPKFYYNNLPLATQVTPDNGPQQGLLSVTVAGANFGFSAGPINCTLCSVSSWISSNSFSCILAPHTGVATVDVEVTVAKAGYFFANNLFTYNPKPVVSQISPTAGPQTGRDVTIQGSNFDGSGLVKFGGQNSPGCSVSSATVIVCQSPARSPGVVDVRVETLPGGASAWFSDYTFNALPTISSANPDRFPAAASTFISILGTGFGSETSTISVMIGGLTCNSATYINSTAVSCTTQALTAGVKNVVVTTELTGTDQNNVVEVMPAPTISGVLPLIASTATSNTFDISGGNLGETGDVVPVTIGGVACAPATVVSGSSVTCSIASGLPSGSLTVAYDSPIYGSATLTDAVTLLDPPTLTSLSVSGGPSSGSTTVNISGARFAAPCTVTIGSDTTVADVLMDSILVTTSANSVGVENVLVSCAQGSAGNNLPYTYFAPPSGLALNVTEGPSVGNQPVLVTGSNFGSDATRMATGLVITMGDVPCATSQWLSDSSALCITPPNSPGSVGVTVTSTMTGSTSMGGTPFTYHGRPVLSSVFPDNGPQAGGIDVTVIGTGFGASVRDVEVLVSGMPCASSSWVNNTQVVCHGLPERGTAGTTWVIVEASLRQTTAPSYLFTTNPLPTLGALDPSSVDRDGGNTITASVTNAGPSYLFYIDGEACGSTLTSPPSCVNHPARPSGTSDTEYYDFRLVSPTHGEVNTTIAYLPLPQITAISPQYAPLAGSSDTYVVSGSFFLDVDATIRIGTVSCTSSIFNADDFFCTGMPAGTGVQGVSILSDDMGNSVVSSASITYLPRPIVNTVTPNSGTQLGGVYVTITGSGFGPVSNTVTATIDGEPCLTSTYLNETAVECVTPGSIVTGAVDVAVESVLAGLSTGSVSYTNIVAGGPVTFDVAYGPTTGGRPVRIFGSSMSSDGVGLSITFNGVPADDAVWVSAEEVTCTSPPGTAGLAETIVSTTETGAFPGITVFTYLAPPSITSTLLEARVGGGGPDILVHGSGFGPVINNVTITFDGVECGSAEWLSPTVLKCVAPPAHAAASSLPVRVTTLASGESADAAILTYSDAPVVSSSLPLSVPSFTSVNIAVIGNNFGLSHNVLAIKLGEVPCLGSGWINSTLALCVLSSVAPGNYTISVDSSSTGNSTSATAFFTVNALPTVMSINVTEGTQTGGVPMRITGTLFLPTSVVSFGTTSAATTYISDTVIECLSPILPDGAHRVSVYSENFGASDDSYYFTALGQPIVLSLAPNAGPRSGGGNITVSGVNFGSSPNTVSCHFNSGEITVPGAWSLGNAIVCTVPSMASTSVASPFTMTVEVTAAVSGQSTSNVHYQYMFPPSISGVEPAEGPTGGGTSIVVSCSVCPQYPAFYFGTPSNYTSFNVAVAGSPYVVTLPAWYPGLTNMTMFSPSRGLSAPFPFFYNTPPTITSLSRPGLPIDSSATDSVINIIGSSFGSVSNAVSVNGTACTWINPSKISCTLPTVSVGRSVTLALTCTLSGTVTFPFTYYVPPTIDSLNVTEGPQGGGTAVLISGTGFGPDPGGPYLVSIRSKCASVTWLSDTEIICVTAAASAGISKVTVESPIVGKISESGLFAYNRIPVVESISPTFVPISGTRVSFIGKDFGKTPNTITVIVGNTTLEGCLWISSELAQCDVPPVPSPGAMDVVFSTVHSGAAPAFSLLYVDGPIVADTGVLGGVAGGYVVTFTGRNFGDSSKAINITIDGVPCLESQYLSSKAVSCLVPAGASAGKKLVLVEILDGGGDPGSPAVAFEYVELIPNILYFNNSLPGTQTAVGSTLSFTFQTNYPVFPFEILFGDKLCTLEGGPSVWTCTRVWEFDDVGITGKVTIVPGEVVAVGIPNAQTTPNPHIMDMCFPNAYGPTCLQVCDCLYGYCDNGPLGMGGQCTECLALTGWVGAVCDFCVGSINGFSGWEFNSSITDNNCNVCGEGWFGSQCISQCECAGDSDCSDGLEGDGSCVCAEDTGWSGAGCDECFAPWWGIKCNLACTCLNGECFGGTSGDGTCATCVSDDWFGSLCDSRCTCINGVCSSGVAGDGHCVPDTCVDGWTGLDCNTCSGGYQLIAGECSNLCARGRFSLPNSTSCQRCPNGTVALELGSARCTNCSSGSVPTPDGLVCTPCEPGTYAPVAGMSTCLPCPGGSYQPAGGSDICIPCSKGTFAANPLARLGRTDCELCPPGFYATDPGKTSCDMVPPGHYATGLGNTLPQPCPVGTASEEFGSDECPRCPFGSFGNSTGLINCTLCPIGQFIDQIGRSECSPCPVSEYSDEEGLEKCKICPPQSSTDGQGRSSVEECKCLPLTYRGPNKECAECPSGGQCLGGEEPPRPANGFFSTESTNVFVACIPSDACVGADSCAEGYEGSRCGECSEQYYRLGSRCERCNGNSSWRIVLFAFLMAAVAVAFLVGAHFFRLSKLAPVIVYEDNENGELEEVEQQVSTASARMAIISIAINFFQVVAILANFDLRYPGPVQSTLNLFTAFNLNLDLLQTECSVRTPYATKWIIALFLPVIVIAFLALVVAASQIVKTLNPRIFAFDHNDLGVASLLIVSFSYASLSLKALEIFDCTKQEDGRSVLDASPTNFCFTTWWYTLLPVALLANLCYSFGIPAALLYILRSNKESLRDPSSPVYIRLGVLIARFRIELMHWEVVIMLRKVAIVAAQLFFGRFAVIQALLAQMALLINLVAQINWKPFKIVQHNRMELVLIFASVVVLAFGQVFWALEQLEDDAGAVKILFSVVLIVLLVVTVIAIIGVAIAGFLGRTREMSDHKGKLKEAEREQEKIAHILAAKDNERMSRRMSIMPTFDSIKFEELEVEEDMMELRSIAPKDTVGEVGNMVTEFVHLKEEQQRQEEEIANLRTFILSNGLKPPKAAAGTSALTANPAGMVVPPAMDSGDDGAFPGHPPALDSGEGMMTAGRPAPAAPAPAPAAPAAPAPAPAAAPAAPAPAPAAVPVAAAPVAAPMAAPMASPAVAAPVAAPVAASPAPGFAPAAAVAAPAPVPMGHMPAAMDSGGAVPPVQPSPALPPAMDSR